MAAIDQQPDLPAILARQYLEVGLMPGRDIFTNPAVVNASNVDKVIEGGRASSPVEPATGCDIE